MSTVLYNRHFDGIMNVSTKKGPYKKHFNPKYDMHDEECIHSLHRDDLINSSNDVIKQKHHSTTNTQLITGLKKKIPNSKFKETNRRS